MSDDKLFVVAGVSIQVDMTMHEIFTLCYNAYLSDCEDHPIITEADYDDMVYGRKSKVLQRLFPSTSKEADKDNQLEATVSAGPAKKKKKLPSVDAAAGSTTATRCKICKSSLLRVVNIGRKDGKNILECANRNCLATICLTDAAENTFVGQPPDSVKNYGWYLRDPAEVRYPSMEMVKHYEATAWKPSHMPQIQYDDQGNMLIPCPGQRELVRLM